MALPPFAHRRCADSKGNSGYNIMSMKRFQVHSLITFAHVQGHRITYPDRNKN